MMLLCYVLSTATRSAISLVHTFWPLLALVVATEAFSSPVSVIADTVIAAACAEVRTPAVTQTPDIIMSTSVLARRHHDSRLAVQCMRGVVVECRRSFCQSAS